MTYDPAFTNTASCKSRITFIDGDKGILSYRGYPIEQLAEKSTYLETAYLLMNGELPTTAQLEALDAQHHAPHDRPREHQEVHRRLPLRRASDGRCSCRTVGALSTFYPDAKNIYDPESRRDADHPADRQDADARRVRLPPRASACRTSTRTTTSRYTGNFLQHDVQDDGAASTSRTRCSSARSTCSSSCTPTTSRTARPTRCAASAARRSIPYSATAAAVRRALRAAARRRERGGAAHAAGDRLVKNVPAFIERVKERRGRG